MPKHKYFAYKLLFSYNDSHLGCHHGFLNLLTGDKMSSTRSINIKQNCHQVVQFENFDIWKVPLSNFALFP